MGNSQTSKVQTLKDKYKPVKMVHPIFGDILVYNEKMFEKSIQLIQLTDEMKQNYQKRLQVKCPNLISTYNVDFQQLSQGCGSGKYQFIVGQWEYPGIQTLYDINEYKDNMWSESQLWEIASQIINGCASLEKVKLVHGDLRLEKIFVSDKQIKLADHTIIPDLRTSYQEAMLGNSYFLSPEQMMAYRKQQPVCPQQNNKTDVYAFGIVILLLGTNTTPKRNEFIKDPMVSNMLQKLSSQYSACFLSFITQTLHKNPKERPTFRELQEQLKPFQEQIKSGEPFYENIVFCNCQDDTHKHGQHISQLQQECRQPQQNYMTNYLPQNIVQPPMKFMDTMSPRLSVNTMFPSQISGIYNQPSMVSYASQYSNQSSYVQMPPTIQPRSSYQPIENQNINVQQVYQPDQKQKMKIHIQDSVKMNQIQKSPQIFHGEFPDKKFME